jgi:hypothetical protein
LINSVEVSPVLDAMKMNVPGETTLWLNKTFLTYWKREGLIPGEAWEKKIKKMLWIVRYVLIRRKPIKLPPFSRNIIQPSLFTR